MIKPNRVFKKRDTPKKGPTENNIQEREETRKMFENTSIKQKKNNRKKRTDMQKQTKMKQCPTKREMNEQVFLIWRSV